MEKQKLYKSAFSIEFQVYVSIRSATENEDGTWTYTASSWYKEGAIFKDKVFHESELEMFIL